MKELLVQLNMDFIRFNHESEGYPMDEETESLAFDVLTEELSSDQAIDWVVDHYNLEAKGTINSHNYYEVDRALCEIIETRFVAIRTAGLLVNKFEEKLDFDYLKMIHSTVFGDLYPKAGEVRTKIIKTGKMYCMPEYINSNAQIIFDKLKKDNYLEGLPREAFINDLAYYMGELVALHPFIDGNGRTIRIFFDQLIERAGYSIDYSDSDHDRVLEAELAALDGDYQLLIFMLSDMIFKD